MVNKKPQYSGFTLLEMLIVMSILVILFGLSFAAFQNLQTTIRLNEFVNGFEQNIRKIQRDAMLLEKKPGDTWIYGLGFDLTSFASGTYTPFKWCSGEPDFGAAKTRGAVPNFDGTQVGKIPNPVKLEGSCVNTNELKQYPLFGEKKIFSTGTKMPQVYITTDSVGAQGGITNKTVAYVLFESVTGRAFFYNSAGDLLNYDLSITPPTLIVNPPSILPLPLVIKIQIKNSTKGKKITILQTSGKIMVDSL